MKNSLRAALVTSSISLSGCASYDPAMMGAVLTGLSGGMAQVTADNYARDAERQQQEQYAAQAQQQSQNSAAPTSTSELKTPCQKETGWVGSYLMYGGDGNGNTVTWCRRPGQANQ
jgi:hypothetical protein